MDNISSEKNKLENNVTDAPEIINLEEYESISNEEPIYVTIDIGKNYKNYKKFNLL